MNKIKIGIYNPYITTRGGGEKLTIATAEHLSKAYDVSLIVREKVEIKELAEYFNADLSRIRLVVPESPEHVMHKLFTTHKLPWPARVRSLAYAVADYRSLKELGFDIFINNLYQSGIPCPAAKGIYVCMFPQVLKPNSGKKTLLKNTYRGAMLSLEKKLIGSPSEALKTYQVIAAISKFTELWIEKRWNRTSSLLYPFCEPIGLPTTVKKEKIILHTGRYFADMGENHHKRQDILIDAFKGMTSSHADGWELHLVGSTAQDSESLKYTIQMVQRAEGYPIYFHFNAEYKTLEKLYQTASIYWHATGYGKDADQHPEKQEHFGITTVEAMSAGAVPVVIGSAGQRETVVDCVSGFLWKSSEELVTRTNQLIHDPQLLAQMSTEAIVQSQKFGRAAFNKQVDALMDELSHAPTAKVQ